MSRNVVVPFRRPRRARSRLRVVAGLAASVAALGAGGAVWLAQEGQGHGATVAGPRHLRMCGKGEANAPAKTCIVDGDTLWLDGVSYRMQGYDTPEPQSDICGGAREVAIAHRASARFQQLLNSNEWTIEKGGRDSTGRRVLATIRIGGRDIGDILISERLARRWPDGDEWWCRG